MSHEKFFTKSVRFVELYLNHEGFRVKEFLLWDKGTFFWGTPNMLIDGWLMFEKMLLIFFGSTSTCHLNMLLIRLYKSFFVLLAKTFFLSIIITTLQRKML